MVCDFTSIVNPAKLSPIIEPCLKNWLRPEAALGFPIDSCLRFEYEPGESEVISVDDAFELFAL